MRLDGRRSSSSGGGSRSRSSGRTRSGAHIRAACISLAFRALAPASVVLFATGAAHAQSEADLRAARKLFADGMKDQDEGHFDAALEKFRRVQQVKDTQPVRYRIASCLESLGKLREAQRAYEATLDKGVAGQTDDVTRAAREKSDAVAKRLARVTLTLSPHAAGDAEVRVDDEPISAGALGTEIPLDPGTHEVVGTSKDAPTFRTTLTLSEGGQAQLMVMLDPPSAAPPEPPPKPPETPHPAGSSRKTWGYVAIAGGGVLIAGGVVAFVLRHGDIAELQRSCPGGVCPIERRDELTSTHSRAVLEGVLGWTLVATGAVAAGAGIFLLATDRHESTAIAPFFTRGGGGFSLTRTF